MNSNKEVYSTDEAVNEYAGHEALQKGEVSIFSRFRDKVAGSVLDIGIGAGRTTAHLIKISKDYVGVDYSQPFVDYCKSKYANGTNVKIQYGDARDLNNLKSENFDFIVFSYNGIDYVELPGRNQILSEFSRLLKKDGVLCFSFHNKGNLDKLYSFQYPRNPFKYLWEWKRRNTVKQINGDKEQYRSKDWFIIKDGGENFTLDTFYADPLFQQRCLEEFGFKTFYFYDAVTGDVISSENVTKSNTPWVYIVALK